MIGLALKRLLGLAALLVALATSLATLDAATRSEPRGPAAPGDAPSLSGAVSCASNPMAGPLAGIARDASETPPSGGEPDTTADERSFPSVAFRRPSSHLAAVTPAESSLVHGHAPRPAPARRTARGAGEPRRPAWCLLGRWLC